MIEDLVKQKGYLTLGTRMKRLSERLFAQVQELIREHDLPIQANHYPLLASLDENGPLTIGELANSLGFSQPGVTRSVGQLARLNLVDVRRGETDQRQKVVELSEEGRVITNHGRTIIWPQIEQCIAGIYEGHTGNLLEQLDHLENELGNKSMAQRISESREE